MRENSLDGNCETPPTSIGSAMDRLEKASRRSSSTHVGGESDDGVVPVKSANNAGQEAATEPMEGRPSTKGNTLQAATPRTRSRTSVSIALQRVREVARRERSARFTALLHHVTVDLLRESFHALKRSAAPGVDQVTWEQYERDLENRLVDLHQRIHSGTYRAQPSRRTYIPKADGRLRPLGIASLADKIAQQAVVTVLNQIYEVDFKGFSYGFRPGRSQHDALDALHEGIVGKKVNWILDADIQGFFDAIDLEWLDKFLRHRVADRRLLRLIHEWLRAGISENGKWTASTVGTPQGAVISPLLANVFLHYVLDLWAHWWRTHYANGEIIIVRYADDFVIGFQHRHDAERFLVALRERFHKFALTLHPEKTRLIEFGRFATENRRGRGECKPESFNFLGFTHTCACWRNGKFRLLRRTIKKRLRAKLAEIRQKLLARRHQCVDEVGQWLRSIVRGYYNYHSIPGNSDAMQAFHNDVARSWLHALRRRSQRRRMPWARFRKLLLRWIPRPRLVHPPPRVRFLAKHPR